MIKSGLTFDDALSKHPGIARYILDLYSALKKVEGVTPKRVFLRSSGGQRDAIIAPQPRKSFLRRILRYQGDNFFADLKKEGKLDIIHDTGNYHLPLRRGGLIGVETIHDIGPKTFPDFYPKGIVNDYFERLPRVLESAEAVVAVSQATKDQLVEYYDVDKSKIHVIHYGLDPMFVDILEGRWKITEKEVSSIAARNGIYGKYILSVGTLNPRRNVERRLTE